MIHCNEWDNLLIYSLTFICPHRCCRTLLLQARCCSHMPSPPSTHLKHGLHLRKFRKRMITGKHFYYHASQWPNICLAGILRLLDNFRRHLIEQRKISTGIVEKAFAWDILFMTYPKHGACKTRSIDRSTRDQYHVYRNIVSIVCNVTIRQVLSSHYLLPPFSICRNPRFWHHPYYQLWEKERERERETR